MRSLATDHRADQPGQRGSPSVQINTPLNELLVEALQVTGQLNKQDCYDLDYDNQVIATEKWDAARTYKKCNGYQPAVALHRKQAGLHRRPGGNGPATYAQQQTLKRVFETLSNHQVSIGAVPCGFGLLPKRS
ncbi:MAG: hypothetical protein U5K69_18155 [Balneolaceae bacterium]|nr:hypothetical protein [Balneolaceae bacterium]